MLGIPDEVIWDFRRLSEHNGVAIRDRFVSEFDEYEMVKKKIPMRLLCIGVRRFSSDFTAATTPGSLSMFLNSCLPVKTFCKSISTPMCGFPVHVTEQYTQRLLDAGNDVVAST